MTLTCKNVCGLLEFDTRFSGLGCGNNANFLMINFQAFDPFWMETFFKPFSWIDFGTIWARFGTDFGANVGPILDQNWCIFGAGGTSVPPNSRKHCSKSLAKSSFETTAGERRRRPWLGGRFGLACAY